MEALHPIPVKPGCRRLYRGSFEGRDSGGTKRNGKRILGYAEYKESMVAGWPVRKEAAAKDQIKHTFELRFTERISSGNLAYEVGYFKNESTIPSGEKRSSYGKFHVTLRKEIGHWKILVDSDSNEGGTITEEMFQAASPLK